MRFTRFLTGLAAVAGLAKAGVVNERAPQADGDAVESAAPQVTRMVIVNYLPAVSVSTVYSTSDVTVWSCASTVTDCPAESTSLVTAVISVSTTLCPLTLTSVSTSNVTQTAPSTVATSSIDSGILPPSVTPETPASTTASTSSSQASDNTADAAAAASSTALETTYRTGSTTVTIWSSSMSYMSSAASGNTTSSSGATGDVTGIPPYGSPASTDANGNTVDAIGGSSTSSPASDVTGVPVYGSISMSGDSTVRVTSTVLSTARITVTQSTSSSEFTGDVAAGSGSSSLTGIANNATMATSSSVAGAVGGTAPLSSFPYSFVPATSTSLAGAIGGSSGLPIASATNNGTLGAGSPSASPSPYTGNGVVNKYDSKVLICWALALLGGVLLV